MNTRLGLRVSQQFCNDNSMSGILRAQDEAKSYVVKSPQSAQHGL